MSRTEHGRRKVVIVGAGAVGSTFAYALAREGTAEEIVLIDRNRDLAEGQVLDLSHGIPFLPSVRFAVGDEADYADASVIVLTAGAKQKPGESRLGLLARNAAITESIVDAIVSAGSEAVVLTVSNPVDVLTYVGLKHSGRAKGRFIGSGTVLDSARLRYFLAEDTGIGVSNIHAYVLGEHGDSEIAAWSITNIAGMPIERYCPMCDRCGRTWAEQKAALLEKVRRSAYHIIDYKGATNYAVGLALVRIVGSILRDEHRILTVSTLLEGEYGLDDVCLSVPALVTAAGVERVIEMDLSPEDLAGLQRSGAILKERIASLRAGRE